MALARKQLAEYMRKVWKDEVAALEVGLAVDEDNYDKKMTQAVRKKLKDILLF